jgi:hypothetical protein
LLKRLKTEFLVVLRCGGRGTAALAGARGAQADTKQPVVLASLLAGLLIYVLDLYVDKFIDIKHKNG